MKEPETLADFVRRIRKEKRLSLIDVVRQSGGLISDGYVSQIENGTILNVSPKKLSALAKGLHEPDDLLFALARGQSLNDPGGEELQLLTVFRNLPFENRLDLLALARALHRRHGSKMKDAGTQTADRKQKPRRAA